MTNNIITRDFAGLDTTFPVRIVELDGQPWFVATDIRQVLGLTQGGTNFKHLGADEVRRIPSGLITGKGMSTASLISESGLYKLIMRSDKPQARLFQDWVTRDVLPAIRKDGAYIMGEEKVATGEMSEDELVMKAMSILSSKVELNALTTINTNATLTMSSREIAELLDVRHDNVKRTIDTLAGKGLVTFTQTEEKGLGRPLTLYHVGKRDSYVIVAQLSPEFTAKLVDRWQELEEQVAAKPALPTTAH